MPYRLSPAPSRIPLGKLPQLALLCLTLLVSPAYAQRVALLLGNADYGVGRLTNPPQDVQVMESALRKLGFKVQKVLNANQNQMKRAVRDFGTAAQGAEVAWVYYSGHATQANGENYLLPVGASIDKESDYEVEAVSANAVLRQIQGARPKAAILVLDACRDNPLAAVTKSATKGLSRMDAPTGTMIAFATAPNTTASDNGHYAKVLAQELQKPGQELMDVFRNTTAEVRRLSGGKQEPRISEMSISERVYLAGAQIQPPTPPQPDPEQEAWEAAKRTHTATSYQAYLRRYPNGRYADSASVALAGLQPAAVVQSPAPATQTLDGRYQILAGGAEVKDLETGLVWQRCSVGQSRDGRSCVGDVHEFTFDSAQSLGRSGWRTPTVRELQSLRFCSKGFGRGLKNLGDGKAPVLARCIDGSERPTIQKTAFPQTLSKPYLSSTSVARHYDYAWVVAFDYGNVYDYGRYITLPVRLVR